MLQYALNEVTLKLGVGRDETISFTLSDTKISEEYKTFLEDAVVIKIKANHNDAEAVLLRNFIEDVPSAQNVVGLQTEKYEDDLYAIFFGGYWFCSPLLFNKKRHNFISLTDDNLNLNYYYDITAKPSYDWALDHA
ncbi:hypothetical protein [Vibrio crassostreae]|uniref:hypothetical protein n=1 Tax=Vibrio crassostreae TaxID=246167 RepID=UPI001B30A165|nr:hypothetical protein [Vibrio crassostreae]